MSKTKAAWLSKHLGGKWTYDGMATWWCDDGKRNVSRVSTNFYDESPRFHSPPRYILYGDGPPRDIPEIREANALVFAMGGRDD